MKSKNSVFSDDELISLERKLGINSKLVPYDLSKKRRKSLYKKIENEEGMGEDFMNLLDNIISGKNKYKRNLMDNILSSEIERKRTELPSNYLGYKLACTPNFGHDSIIMWQEGYLLKLQGLFNRLSEGNMTLILENITELLKETVYSAFVNHNFEYRLLSEFRNNCIDKGRKVEDHFNRATVIIDIVESDLVKLFIKNCITNKYTTISLITVYSAVISSFGILTMGRFNERLIVELNKIYNETLERLLHCARTDMDFYDNKLILRRITITLVTIYRCGTISANVLKGFVIAGVYEYSKSWKLNIHYWESLFDNILTIIRGSAFILRMDSYSTFDEIIRIVALKISPESNTETSHGVGFLSNNTSNIINPQRLNFIIEELDEWRKSLDNPLLYQRLRKRQGLIERQLYTVHYWSIHCNLTGAFQLIQKTKKSHQSSTNLELVSYPNTILDYCWQPDNVELYCYESNLKNSAISQKTCGFYNVGFKQLNPGYKKHERQIDNKTDNNGDLLRLASKLRLSSDIQRSIFVALMGAYDSADAVRRLTILSHNNSKPYICSVINVTIISSFSERVYNPFYFQVLKALTELPESISKKLSKHIISCFSHQFGILSTFGIRKVMIFSNLVKDCIVGGIFGLRIIRFLKINDLNSIAGPVGLFLKELVMSLLCERKMSNDQEFLVTIFGDISKIQEIKDAILFTILTQILPAIDLKSMESNNELDGISKIEVLKVCSILSE
ncbi:Suppressor of glycerol defect protein 1 [Cryptosporidium felis]|nr:Suppressor of glycerol defect protein 1 [Cryptosporidium felis]